LVAVRIGETLVEECGACAGMWLPHGTFETLQQAREEHAVILGMPATVATKPLETVRYYPCPACAAMMNRVNFARCSGVIIDVCKSDGIWFDADELRGIVAFIHSGGMTKARDREVERLRDQARASESAHLQLQMERAHDGMRYGSATSGGSILGDVLGVVGDLLRYF